MENVDSPVFKCTKCEAENAVGAKFCSGCGSRLRWIYPERKCTHCGNEWTPRKVNPKTCPACGYVLAKDNIVEIVVPMIQDEGSSGMLETKCAACGKQTRKYALFRRDRKEPWKDVCYDCLIDYFKLKQKEGDDIVEGSFVTFGIEKLQDGTERLIEKEPTS